MKAHNEGCEHGHVENTFITRLDDVTVVEVPLGGASVGAPVAFGWQR